MPAPTSLESIARQAMVEHGLLPEFSPAVLAETSAIVAPAVGTTSDIRDLRGLLWASIDNDTSRDLDQLSVAEALAGGAVKIYVAIADVDASVRLRSAIDHHAQTNTTSCVHGGQDLSDASRKALDRSDLPRRRSRPLGNRRRNGRQPERNGE
jgi:exoribonuclease R